MQVWALSQSIFTYRDSSKGAAYLEHVSWTLAKSDSAGFCSRPGLNPSDVSGSRWFAPKQSTQTADEYFMIESQEILTDFWCLEPYKFIPNSFSVHFLTPLLTEFGIVLSLHWKMSNYLNHRSFVRKHANVLLCKNVKIINQFYFTLTIV